MALQWHLPRPNSEAEFLIGDWELAGSFPVVAVNAGNSRWTNSAARVERTPSTIWAIELVTAGDCLFVQDGRSYVVKPGMLFMQHRGRSITYTVGPAGFVHKRFVGLDGNLLELLIEKCGLHECDVVDVADVAPVVDVMKKIVRSLRPGSGGLPADLSHLAYQLLVLTAENHRRAGYPAQVQAAISFMQRHLDRSLSIAEIAGAACASQPHIFRLFRDCMHTSPLKFFLSMKLKSAAQFVQHTPRPLKEIALMHGFDEPSYFSKQFKEFLGESPREYRLRHRRQ